ncbi:hypothetical protein [Streptomyces sp. TRM68367]|uniref:hypothetical protein n=1 Tax=Streptomyces sp. TRM68367 TaxID=2758415 RepID=UPI00165C96EB|nr:hypothetical protein [Streptomyces sp. TRM68367]MBC9731510.1 hypothetical protein [Streptomyces sp. TRM68367]
MLTSNFYILQFRLRAKGVLSRRSFLLIGPVAFLSALVGAEIPARQAIVGGNTEALPAVSIICLGGAVICRIMHSRIHLQGGRVVIVNPLYSYDFPKCAVRKVDVRRGALVVIPKSADPDEEGVFAVGFAGSLIDMLFGTTDRAAATVRDYFDQAKGGQGSSDEVNRRLVINPLADLLVLIAVVFGGISAVVLL